VQPMTWALYTSSWIVLGACCVHFVRRAGADSLARARFILTVSAEKRRSARDDFVDCELQAGGFTDDSHHNI